VSVEPPSSVHSTDRSEWSLQRSDQPGSALEPYVRAIRSHLPLAVGIVLAVVVGSIAWLIARSPVYESSAQLLVTPVAADDRSFFGLPVVHEAGDPVRTLQTAATLADSTDAAALAARRLGDGWTEKRVRAAVDVQPQGESSILAVQARADSAAVAVAVADAFARAVIDVRAEALQSRVAQAIEAARSQLQAPGLAPAVIAGLSRRLSDLQAIPRGTDPTLSISERATVPRGAEGVPPWLVLLLAIVAGTVLAAGAALLIELVTPQPLTRESEVLSIYPLPVLARVPADRARRRKHGQGALPPHSAAASEAFRFLQLQLELGKGRPRSVLFTSPSRGDGKTDSIVGFARELATAGRSAILLDLDLREPGLARAFGFAPTRDITALLPGAGRLKRALTPVPGESSLRIVAAVQQADGTLLGRLGRLLPDVLDEALRLADYVLIDTPPLGEVGDALQVAGDVDEIIVVCRFGNTRARGLETIRDLSERMGRTPTGYLLIGGRGIDAPRYGPAVADEDPAAPTASDRARRPARAQRS
jgi:Mrp family chromosome partitioning ATPase/capsular polysaccharide biosynthesis protein